MRLIKDCAIGFRVMGFNARSSGAIGFLIIAFKVFRG